MKNKMNRYLYFFIAFTIILGAGCKDKNVPVTSPAYQKPAAKAVESTTPEKEEERVEREAYAYDPKGRRDPFMSLIEVAKEKPQRKKGATPVENYDVGEIKLSAIVWDSHQYYALIILPDNKSYTIRKGMTLGLYGGKVEAITINTVLIREQIKDYRGQFKTKDTILKLRKEGEE
jgi:type IV pilus assembly protein PilP